MFRDISFVPVLLPWMINNCNMLIAFYLSLDVLNFSTLSTFFINYTILKYQEGISGGKSNIS